MEFRRRALNEFQENYVDHAAQQAAVDLNTVPLSMPNKVHIGLPNGGLQPIYFQGDDLDRLIPLWKNDFGTVSGIQALFVPSQVQYSVMKKGWKTAQGPLKTTLLEYHCFRLEG